MKMQISVHDTITPYLKKYKENMGPAFRIAMMSTGKWLRKEVQLEIDRGDAHPLNPYTKAISSIHQRGGGLKILRTHRGRGKGKYRLGGKKSGGGFFPTRIGSAGTIPLLRLKGAVRYEVNLTGTGYGAFRCRIGFLKGMAQKYAVKAAEGYDVQITPRMRKMLFAIGVPLGGLRKLTVPPRPKVANVYDREKHKIQPYFAKRFFQEMGKIKG